MDVVLVDDKDNVIGFREKYAAHKIPVPLHRAISIAILNKDKSKMLITKRAENKPTWPGLWSNAVCTHPYPNETYQDAAERRLYEELGIRTLLKEVFKFTYKAEMYNKIWGERELDHAYIGTYKGRIHPDPNEISDLRWVSVSDLKKDINQNPDDYTPWFKIVLKRLGI